MTKFGIRIPMLLEEKLEGRKVQSLPFLLSRNLKYHTLKNLGFCPNEVIHFNDFDAPKTDNISIKNVCNLLIHSYVFVAEQQCLTAPIKGVFFNSDRTRNQVLYHLKLNNWIRLLQNIGSDYPCVFHLSSPDKLAFPHF